MSTVYVVLYGVACPFVLINPVQKVPSTQHSSVLSTVRVLYLYKYSTSSLPVLYVPALVRTQYSTGMYNRKIEPYFIYLLYIITVLCTETGTRVQFYCRILVLYRYTVSVRATR